MKLELTTKLSRVLKLHGELESMARTSLEKAIEIGGLLTDIKNSVKFRPWLAENVPFGKSVAYRYINLYSRREELSQSGTLSVNEAYKLLSEGPKEPSNIHSSNPAYAMTDEEAEAMLDTSFMDEEEEVLSPEEDAILQGAAEEWIKAGNETPTKAEQKEIIQGVKQEAKKEAIESVKAAKAEPKVLEIVNLVDDDELEAVDLVEVVPEILSNAGPAAIVEHKAILPYEMNSEQFLVWMNNNPTKLKSRQDFIEAISLWVDTNLS